MLRYSVGYSYRFWWHTHIYIYVCVCRRSIMLCIILPCTLACSSSASFQNSRPIWLPHCPTWIVISSRGIAHVEAGRRAREYPEKLRYALWLAILSGYYPDIGVRIRWVYPYPQRNFCINRMAFSAAKYCNIRLYSAAGIRTRSSSWRCNRRRNSSRNSWRTFMGLQMLRSHRFAFVSSRVVSEIRTRPIKTRMTWYIVLAFALVCPYDAHTHVNVSHS